MQLRNERRDLRGDPLRLGAQRFVVEERALVGVRVDVPALPFQARGDVLRGHGRKIGARQALLPVGAADAFAHGVGVAHHEQEAGIAEVARQIVDDQQEGRRFGHEHGCVRLAAPGLEVPGAAGARPVVEGGRGEGLQPVHVGGPEQSRPFAARFDRLPSDRTDETGHALAVARQIPRRGGCRQRLAEKRGTAVVRRDHEEMRGDCALHRLHGARPLEYVVERDPAGGSRSVVPTARGQRFDAIRAALRLGQACLLRHASLYPACRCRPRRLAASYTWALASTST